MEDVTYTNQEWVDVGATGTPAPPSTPPPRRRQGLRVLVFVLLVVMGALLVAAFIWGLFIGRAEPEVSAQDEAIRQAIIDCNREQNPDRCLENLAAQLAQENGDAVYCDMAETDDVDGCYFLAALSSRDRSVCAEIEEIERRESCEDTLVNDPVTYEDCSNYNDPNRVEECQQVWIRDQWRAGDCSSVLVDDSLCEGQSILAVAREERDPSLCDQIVQEEMRDACFELVGPGDQDGDGVDADEEAFRGTSDFDIDSDDDGLTDAEEIFTYGTDPTLVDTDGDSYSDKLEVDSGFNPLR